MEFILKKFRPKIVRKLGLKTKIDEYTFFSDYKFFKLTICAFKYGHTCSHVLFVQQKLLTKESQYAISFEVPPI